MTRPPTIPAILEQTVTARADATALLVPRQGEFAPVTWREIADRVRQLATALTRAGVQPQDRVAQVAENRYEWILADLAIHVAGGVHVPIHVTLSGPQIAHQIEHSGAKVVLTSTAELLLSFQQLLTAAQPTTHVLYEDSGQVAAVSLEQFSQGGSLDNDALERAAESAKAEDLATILYTSGTTGEPKGVMLSQGNLASNAIATAEVVGFESDDLRLGFLPLSHIYARTCDLYCWLYHGTVLALAQSRDSVIGDCQTLNPTTLNGVPYFYDKLVQKVTEAGAAESPGALRQLFGGKIQRCFCGGAALPTHVAEFFAKQGVPLLPGYGLTESSPVIACSVAESYRVGTVGRPLPDVEVRIAEDGEILSRGPHIMQGYWKDDAATREAVRDGWLYTGDWGSIDDAGHLIISGRKKEILVLATGKNVSPAYVEGLLTSSPLIEQAMVVGDDRKFVAALIVPQEEALKRAVGAEDETITDVASFLARESVQSVMREEIDRVQTCCAHEEGVRAFTLLDRAFSIEAGEMTAKLSLRREVITDHFRDEINRMYAEQ